MESGDEVAVDAEGGSGGVADGLLVGVVAYAEVVDGVGDEVGDVFVVEVGGDAERFAPEGEVPVGGGGGLVGALGGDAAAEGAVGTAQLAVEGGLLVDACGYAVEDVGAGMGLVACGYAGGEEELRVES